jgi:hypothetical protein
VIRPWPAYLVVVAGTALALHFLPLQELLCEMAPDAGVIALLVNPNNRAAEPKIRDVQEAARAKGVQLDIFNAGSESEIDAAFNALVQRGRRASDAAEVGFDRIEAYGQRHGSREARALDAEAGLGGNSAGVLELMADEAVSAGWERLNG